MSWLVSCKCCSKPSSFYFSVFLFAKEVNMTKTLIVASLFALTLAACGKTEAPATATAPAAAPAPAAAETPAAAAPAAPAAEAPKAEEKK
jgi:hypothetical protein